MCFQDDDDSLEIVLGRGYIQTINSAGYLQVVIEKLCSTDAAREIYGRIENTKYYKQSIKVKPSIYKNLFRKRYFLFLRRRFFLLVNTTAFH